MELLVIVVLVILSDLLPRRWGSGGTPDMPGGHRRCRL